MLLSNLPFDRVDAGQALLLRNELLQDIFADFRHAFPDLLFELDEASATVNAQAFVRGGRRVVRMYGGLAYHATVGADGLVFALLHEVGHHLSSGGRLASRDELGCECAADRWALTKGAAKLRKETERTFAIAEVLSSLDKLAGLACCGRKENEDGPQICWAKDWPKRQRILARPASIPAIPRCYLTEFFTSESNYV